MRGKRLPVPPAVPVRFAVVTLDAHLAGAFDEAQASYREGGIPVP